MARYNEILAKTRLPLYYIRYQCICHEPQTIYPLFCQTMRGINAKPRRPLQISGYRLTNFTLWPDGKRLRFTANVVVAGVDQALELYYMFLQELTHTTYLYLSLDQTRNSTRSLQKSNEIYRDLNRAPYDFLASPKIERLDTWYWRLPSTRNSCLPVLRRLLVEYPKFFYEVSDKQISRGLELSATPNIELDDYFTRGVRRIDNRPLRFMQPFGILFQRSKK